MANKIITCTKRFPSVPFAHRQPNSDGHCKYIHGHGWVVEVEFISRERDQCGFVMDFGKLQSLKDILKRFDHSLVLNETDPELPNLKDSLYPLSSKKENFAIIITVPDCSSEGLADYFFEKFATIIYQETGGRVTVKRVTVFEDEKNSATCEVAL